MEKFGRSIFIPIERGTAGACAGNDRPVSEGVAWNRGFRVRSGQSWEGGSMRGSREREESGGSRTAGSGEDASGGGNRMSSPSGTAGSGEDAVLSSAGAGSSGQERRTAGAGEDAGVASAGSERAADSGDGQERRTAGSGEDAGVASAGAGSSGQERRVPGSGEDSGVASAGDGSSGQERAGSRRASGKLEYGKVFSFSQVIDTDVCRGSWEIFPPARSDRVNCDRRDRTISIERLRERPNDPTATSIVRIPNEYTNVRSESLLIYIYMGRDPERTFVYLHGIRTLVDAVGSCGGFLSRTMEIFRSPPSQSSLSEEQVGKITGAPYIRPCRAFQGEQKINSRFPLAIPCPPLQAPAHIPFPVRRSHPCATDRPHLPQSRRSNACCPFPPKHSLSLPPHCPADSSLSLIPPLLPLSCSRRMLPPSLSFSDLR